MQKSQSIKYICFEWNGKIRLCWVDLDVDRRQAAEKGKDNGGRVDF